MAATRRRSTLTGRDKLTLFGLAVAGVVLATNGVPAQPIGTVRTDQSAQPVPVPVPVASDVRPALPSIGPAPVAVKMLADGTADEAARPGPDWGIFEIPGQGLFWIPAGWRLEGQGAAVFTVPDGWPSLPPPSPAPSAPKFGDDRDKPQPGPEWYLEKGADGWYRWHQPAW